MDLIDLRSLSTQARHKFSQRPPPRVTALMVATACRDMPRSHHHRLKF